MKKQLTEVIILANSRKLSGRCVAGINLSTGEWVRPIPSASDHVVPNEPEIMKLKLLEIAEVPLSGKTPQPPDKYQIENHYVTAYNWKTNGSVKVSQIKKYCVNSGLILHSPSDRVAPSVLDAMNPKDWKSLQLVETKVKFSQDANNKNQWRASFKDGNGNILKLKVTDIIAESELNKGISLDGDCILTVSLGQEYSDKGRLTPYCYKLVAGVIKL